MPPSPDSGALDQLNSALAGRYRLEREIGRGGMASVYLAQDLRNDRQVAIKIIRQELAHAVMADRFLREIRIEARLTHPNIIALLDSGVLEMPSGPPRPFYVMPYVPGESLRQRLDREGSLPVEDAVHLTCEVAAAIDYAHHEGVIHRDIKPENILLVAGHAVIADFGIARVLSTSGPGNVTSGALALGTPYYMSPEQWASDPHVDGRTDIYSLGCVLYEALSGEPPFTGPSVDAIRARHSREVPRPIHTVRPGVPEHIVAALARSMAKVPADRFRTAQEMVAALEHPVPPAPAPRGPGPILGGIVLMTLGISALVWFLLLRPDPAVDMNRFLVLPFEVREGDAPIVTGDMVARGLRSALGRWDDLTIVHNMVLADVLGRRDRPRTMREGLAIARSLGAGYLIWGEVSTSRSGDTTYVQADLYDVAHRAMGPRASHVLALVSETFQDQFAALANWVVSGAVGRPARAAGALTGTSSFDAYRVYSVGDSALAAWNLRLAADKLQQALDLDPTYPQANLSYAQLLHWQNSPSTAWRHHAEMAVRGGDRLSQTDAEYARALLDLADGRFPESCLTYQRLLDRDSRDFTAWFGLGECQRQDQRVERDSLSPSGYRFRSSFHSAIEAHARAFDLVPSIHVAYDGAGFDRLAGVFHTDWHRVRGGFSRGPDSASFAAYPTLAGDTLAFVPYLRHEVYGVRAPPPTRDSAVMRNLARLRRSAESWVRAYPESPPALAIWARALETAGDVASSPPGLPTGLEAVRKARRLTPDETMVATTALTEIRFLIKLQRFDEAKALADSLLARGSAWGGNYEHLASLAALTGQPHRAADLLAVRASEWTAIGPSDRPLTVSTELKASALRLLAYAAFGWPADSVRALEERVRRQVESYSAPDEQSEVLAALMRRPSRYAWHLLAHPVSGEYLKGAVDDLRAGDSAAVRAAIAELDSRRSGFRPGEVAINGPYTEALMLLAIGDSTSAYARLARELSELPTLNRSLLDQYVHAASFVNAMALAAELAAARGESRLARFWARGFVELWSGADPVVQPTLSRLRRLVEE